MSVDLATLKIRAWVLTKSSLHSKFECTQNKARTTHYCGVILVKIFRFGLVQKPALRGIQSIHAEF